jgi:hypothetical protein
MAGQHWVPPDICSAILSEATRSDAAEAVAIHVRPEIHAIICRQAAADPDPSTAGDSTCACTGIRLVVDGRIPALPGYEIHRAVPPADRLRQPA